MAGSQAEAGGVCPDGGFGQNVSQVVRLFVELFGMSCVYYTHNIHIIMFHNVSQIVRKFDTI